MNKRLIPIILAASLLASCGVQGQHRSSSTPSTSEQSTSSADSGAGSEESVSSQESGTASEESTSSESSTSTSLDPMARLLSIEVVSPGTSVFYVGESFNLDGLKVEGTYDDGSKRIISNEDLVFSGVNMKKEGKYTVTIAYLNFTASYSIYVYLLKDVVIHDSRFNDYIDSKNQEIGEYVHVPTVAFVNGEIDFSYFTVQAMATLSDGGLEVPFVFGVDDHRVKILNFDKTILGPQKPKLHFECGSIVAEKEFYVNATNVTPYINRSPEGRFIECRIDPAFKGVAGELSHGTKRLDDSAKSYHHSFASITEALDFLNHFTLDPDVVKSFHLAPGVYEEKIDIKMPHTEIHGNPEDPNQVVIQGNDNIGSRPYLTKANQAYVMAVRETATDFYLEGVKLIHQAYLDPSKDVPGTALIAQADRFISRNNIIAGLDQTIVLSSDRYFFDANSITGRSKIIDDSASGVVHIKDTFFYSLPSIKTERDVMFDFPNSLGGGRSGAAVVSARFENVQFLGGEGVKENTYAIMPISSPYVSVEFHGVTEAKSHLGNSLEELFLFGDFNPEMESIKLRSKGTIRHVELPKPPEDPINLWSVENGRGHFIEDWDGKPSNTYATNDHFYIAFDGFYHSGDGSQTVIAHDFNLDASETEVKINGILSLTPIGGMHYDTERHATFLGKGSKFTVRAQAGSIIYAQTILPEERQFFSTGLGMHDDYDEDNTTINRINRPLYTYHCVGKLGDVRNYVFEALGDCYVKSVVIVPKAMEMDSWQSGEYKYNPTPTDFFFRNYHTGFDRDHEIYYKHIFSQLRENICLQYDKEGYCCVINPFSDRHKDRLRVTLVNSGYVIDTDLSDRQNMLVGVTFAYMDSLGEYYHTRGWYDGGFNAFEFFYVYGKKVPDDFNEYYLYVESEFYDNHGDEYDVLPPISYQLMFNIPDDPNWMKTYEELMSASKSHQGFSMAGTFDGDIPDLTSLGADCYDQPFELGTGYSYPKGYRNNRFPGYVRTVEGGRAFYNQEKGGLTLTEKAYVRTQWYNDDVDTGKNYEVYFRVAKGEKLRVEYKVKSGWENFDLNSPLPISTPDYDVYLFDHNGEKLNGIKTIQLRSQDGSPVTILSYDIVTLDQAQNNN